MSTSNRDTSAVAEASSAPDIDYLAKDYASFRKLILDRLSLSMPVWRERNPADGMVTLVEALAAAADQLSYFQDAVATEAYLGTARLRTSMRRHSRLLDYAMQEGCAARAWVVFHVEGTSPIVFGPGTVLETRTESGGVSGSGAASSVETFETLHSIEARAERNAIEFDTQGARELWLSKGQTTATLIDPPGSEASVALLQAGDVVIFEEIRGPSTGLVVDADPDHRHPVRLIRVTQVTSGSERRLEVEWHAQDALPFPLCAAITIEGELRTISIVRANVALVQHGKRWQGEPLNPPEVPEQGSYRPRLRCAGLTHEVPYDDATARTQPASATLFQEPRAAQPAAVVFAAGRGADERWFSRRDLLASDRFSRDFVVEMSDKGEARLRFGDGHYGRKPAPGTVLLADYRTGNGTQGNVGRDAIVCLGVPDPRISVRNPLPARGGIDPEPIEQVRMNAPHAFRKIERAVTEADYVELALRHPEVLRAHAERRWAGSAATMVLAVVRTGGRPVDAAFQSELGAFLERFRVAGARLEIRGPRYVALHIVLRVHHRPGHFWTTVQAALLNALGSGQLDNGSFGFFHPSRFSFGEPVHLSHILERMMRVPGVASVESTGDGAAIIFRRLGTSDTDSLTRGRISIGPFEIARLDNNPAQPDNGLLNFVEGT